MRPLVRATRLLLVLAVEVVGVAALVAAGRRRSLRVPWAGLGPWLHDAPPADALVALLRWVALAGAVWVLVSTVLYVAACAAMLPAAVGAVRWSTLPVVRRAVDAALAASVAGAAVLVPATAGAVDAPAPTSVPIVRDGRSGHVAELAPDPTPTTSTRPPARMPTPPTSTSSQAEPVLPLPRPTASPGATTEVVVVPGDNLWTLAASHVARVSGRDLDAVDDGEIASYWTKVCDENRTRLVSGDADLVLPGERVLLPPV